MGSGKYRHRITIQRASTTQDTLGQDTTTWIAIAERVPANVRELNGREIYNALQMQSDLSLAIELRWLDGVNSGMRVLWHDKYGDRTLAIEGTPKNPDGRKREMLLMCKQPE